MAQPIALSLRLLQLDSDLFICQLISEFFLPDMVLYLRSLIYQRLEVVLHLIQIILELLLLMNIKGNLGGVALERSSKEEFAVTNPAAAPKFTNLLNFT